MLGIVELVIVFAICWWLVFIPVLGIGTESQEESGEVIKGTESGAPIDHMLPKKALWATIGAVILTALAAIIIPIAR